MREIEVTLFSVSLNDKKDQKMKKYLPVMIIAAVSCLSGAGLAKDRTQEVIQQIQKKDAMVMKTVELEYKQFGNKYFIRINPGQPLVENLKDFCQKRNIRLATINGIGSLQSVTLGFFNPESKEYKQKEFKEPLELAGLTGNVTMKDGEPLLHLHGTVAGDNYKALAGHIVEAQVSLTAEFVIETIDGSLEKTFDPKTGLNLFDFNK